MPAALQVRPWLAAALLAALPAMAGGDDRLTFVPFLRLDAHDENRTHWDIREANWLHLADTWDMTVGVG